MATMDRLRRGIRQYEATTGRKITPEAIQAILSAELEAEQARMADNKRLELNERALEENIRTGREQADQQKSAARTSGAIQAVGTGITAAQMLKGTRVGRAIGLGSSQATQPAITKPVTGTPAITGAAGLTAGESLAAGSATGTALAPATGAGAMTAGEFGAAGSVAGGAELGTATGASATGTGTGASGAGAGGFSGVGAGIGAAVVGDAMIARGVRGEAFGSLAERNRINFSGLEYGGISPGATAVAQKTGIKSPGQISREEFGVDPFYGMQDSVEDVSNFIDKNQPDFVEETLESAGTVICTELFNQGYIDQATILLDGQYRERHISNAAYNGYLAWAKPVVLKMRESKLLTSMIKPFGRAWAHEMAYRMDKKHRRGNLLGKTICWVGVPVCYLIGKTREIFNG